MWDRAGLRPAASQEAAPIPGALSALPAEAGSVLTMGSIREKSLMSGLCVLEREREEHFYFSSSSKFGNGVNTKFPDLPKGQSNRKKFLFQSSQHSAFTLGYLVRAASNFF